MMMADKKLLDLTRAQAEFFGRLKDEEQALKLRWLEFLRYVLSENGFDLKRECSYLISEDGKSLIERGPAESPEPPPAGAGENEQPRVNGGAD